MNKDGQSVRGQEGAGRSNQDRLRRLEAMIDRGPAVAFRWRLEEDFPVEFVTRNVSRLGYDREDFLSGRVSWPGITHPEDEPRLREEVEQYLAEGALEFSQSYRIFAASGDVRWIEDYNQVVRDADGQITHIEGIIWDVTERKQAEEALRASEAKYRSIAENTKDIVYSVDAEGQLTYISPQVASIGLTPEDFVGRNFRELLLPGDMQTVVEDFIKTITTGEEFPTELRLLDGDGREHWFEERGRVLRDEQGRATGITGVLREVTERKRLEAERDWLARLRQLALDAAGMGWWSVEVETGATRWDDRFREIFGLSCNECPDGQTIFSRIHPDDLPGLREKVDAALAPSTRRPYHAEYRVVLPDGAIRWVVAHGLASFEENGDSSRATTFVGTVQDITERKRAEEKRRLLTMELCLAEERERKNLAAILHDDVTQIMVAAKMRVGMLCDGCDRAVCRHDVRNISDLLARALRNTRSLTSQLSHPALHDSGLASAAEWLANDIQELHGLDVTVEAPKGGDPIDLRVRVLLFQCIRELLVNAAKHAGADKAAVRFEWHDGQVRAVVEDDGNGFDPSIVGPNASNGGFGLFSIRERLGALGGRMEIRSAPGEGSAIALVVPCKGCEEPDNGR